jgi:cysteine-rich repeat protein
MGLAACGDNHHVDLPPEVASANVAVSAPQDGAVLLDASATDPEGRPLSYSASTPAHGTVSGTGPSFLYTPAPGYVGTDTIAITVSDGVNTTQVQVTITITAVNHAPVASDVSAATHENQGVAVTLTASDVDRNTTLRYEIVAGPTHGTLAGVAPDLTYTPDDRYHGLDGFTFRATDGTLTSNTATATIEIANVITCGDGLVEISEQCDDGNPDNTDGCLANCMAASCGDGALRAGVEACDDGNGDDTDGCLTSCVAAGCGDGFVQAGVEQCDDGNASSSDGCLTTCVAASCGDGFVEAGIEQCDDGNSSDTDACLASCRAATCGDGVVEAGVEQCDDANQDDGDACHNDCTLTAPPVCGDGQLDAGEECDDGNVADNDGCGHSCKIERCGDGLVQFGRGEQCDDGNAASGDGCDATCLVERFTTTAPVKISGSLSCTTAVANAARKVAVDGSGNLYAVMMCGSAADVAVSTNRGSSFSAPVDLSADLPGAPVTVSQVAVNSGPTGVAYVALMLDTGAVYLRTTQDAGATWGAAVPVGTATSPSSGLSLQSFNDDVYVGFSASGGVAVARNHSRGAGSFDLTTVAMSIAFFDLLYDVVQGTLAVCADTPTFHIRASGDGGATFASEVNPAGQQYYSDWAVGNGQIFAVGTNLGSSGNATSIYVIPTSALSTSTSVAGLPSVSTAQTRSVAADAGGNAFVASQLNGGGVQLDRLAFGGSALDAPRSLSATGGSPVAAPLPGSQGAAVVFTVGTEVWATVQAY